MMKLEHPSPLVELSNCTTLLQSHMLIHIDLEELFIVCDLVMQFLRICPKTLSLIQMKKKALGRKYFKIATTTKKKKRKRNTYAIIA